MANRSATSYLGVIALVLVIVAAIYFILNQADEPELEIDIGALEGDATVWVALG